jgi:hypothetical protein
MPAIEARAREELAASLDELQAGMLRSLNAGVSRSTDNRLCTLMMIHTARCLHDETTSGEALTDGEKWRVLVNLLGNDFVAHVEPAVRKLLQLKEATEANG